MSSKASLSVKQRQLALTTHPFYQLSDEERKAIYEQKYFDEGKSWRVIAKELNLSKSTVMRDAHKLGIKSRDSSEATLNAMKTGRFKHPTKGKKMSDEFRRNVSRAVAKRWEEMSDEQRQKHIERCRQLWHEKTPEEKEEFFRRSRDAVLRAAREGSKMEKYLYQVLTREGFKVDQHKKHILLDREFHIDLFVRDCRTIIELDGPTHYQPVFGEKELLRTQATDAQKTGLALDAGLVVIRVKITNNTSRIYMERVADAVLHHLRRIKESFPPLEERYIEIWMANRPTDSQ